MFVFALKSTAKKEFYRTGTTSIKYNYKMSVFQLESSTSLSTNFI